MSLLIAVLITFLGGSPPDRVDFDSEVIPLLTRVGCNSAACHGAAAGRGGFALSLWGSDPASDYESIVLALEGRRVNLADPPKSLVLRKPTGAVRHGGGTVIESYELVTETMREWIRQGAQRGDPPSLLRFEANAVALNPTKTATRFQLKSRAWDSVGERDVTQLTTWTTSDPTALSIEYEHIVQLHRGGRHVVFARYRDRLMSVVVTAPLRSAAADHSDVPRNNAIDEHIVAVCSDLNLEVAGSVAPSKWLRRVTLDLTGRLPTPDRVDEAVNQGIPEWRFETVDRLLASPEFVELWSWRLSRWLGYRELPQELQASVAYSDWLKTQIRDDLGFDRMAIDLLTTTGDSHHVGPVNFNRTVADPRGQAELVGRFFLGARLGCANCHNHPLDRWTQDDFHGLAAVFARVERGREVRLGSRGEVSHPRTGEAARPRIPGERFIRDSNDPRQEFADWLVNSNDQRFARVIVNRVWKTLIGRGLIEPVDDMRDTNIATHPALLDHLAAEFIADGYRLNPLIRRIVLSATYSRSEDLAVDGVHDERFLSQAHRRRLEPEVEWDAIVHLTGISEQIVPQQPHYFRAIHLWEPSASAESLTALGRCARVGACNDADQEGSSLASALYRLNGGLMNDSLADFAGRLTKQIDRNLTVREFVRMWYVAALSRYPTEDEEQRWGRVLEVDTKRSQDGREDSDGLRLQQLDRERLQDFVWAMLNCQEFRHK